jgi:hypothetical protein
MGGEGINAPIVTHLATLLLIIKPDSSGFTFFSDESVSGRIFSGTLRRVPPVQQFCQFQVKKSKKLHRFINNSIIIFTRKTGKLFVYFP